jgi:hypothetical protein
MPNAKWQMANGKWQMANACGSNDPVSFGIWHLAFAICHLPLGIDMIGTQ